MDFSSERRRCEVRINNSMKVVSAASGVGRRHLTVVLDLVTDRQVLFVRFYEEWSVSSQLALLDVEPYASVFERANPKDRFVIDVGLPSVASSCSLLPFTGMEILFFHIY
jgi:hypothetical protein